MSREKRKPPCDLVHHRAVMESVGRSTENLCKVYHAGAAYVKRRFSE